MSEIVILIVYFQLKQLKPEKNVEKDIVNLS